MSKKNSAVRGIVIAIAVVLALCTFLARPLRASNTAVVTTVTTKLRRMEYAEKLRSDLWYTDDMHVCSIPCRLDGSLLVSALYVGPLDFVSAGDPLVAFDGPGGEYLLRQAKKALLSARMEYDSCLETLDARRLSLREEIRKLQEDMSAQSGGELTLSAERLARAQSELQGLETGEIDALTLRTLQLEDASEKYDALEALRKQGWVLKSERGGFVQDTRASTGGSYSGRDALMTICGASDALSLLVKIDRNWAYIEADFGVSATISKDGKEARAEWMGEESRDGELFARLSVRANEAAGLLGASDVSLSATSADTAYIVPKSALVAEGEAVYVVRERQGYFGREYYAELCAVQIGDSSGGNVEILRGVSFGERVVVDCDREIRDGDEVMYKIG